MTAGQGAGGGAFAGPATAPGERSAFSPADEAPAVVVGHDAVGPDAGRGVDLAADPSLRDLYARLDLLERRVRAAVDRRRATDPDPDDRFRGLYISDIQVDDLLAGPAEPPVPPEMEQAAGSLRHAIDQAADQAEAAGAPIRLRELGRAFDLQPIDLELLLVALAPDLDPRFERLYGYLHDDVSRRRASAGLALELAGRLELSAAGPARARLGPHGPLVAGGLLMVEDADRPFLTRSLRVPDRVTAHLLGDDAPDPAVAQMLSDASAVPLGDVEALARALEAGVPLVYLHQRPGASGRAMAHAAFDRAGQPVVDIDLERLAPADDALKIAAAASRDARLRGGGLIVGPVDAISERGTATVRAFAESASPVVLVGKRGWDPAWAREDPLVLDAPVAAVAERHQLWVQALDGDVAPDFDPAVVTRAFSLDPEQIARAARAARRSALAADRRPTVADVSAGARSQNAAGLEQLARRIEPAVGWDDLILPAGVATQLREITARARHRDRVIGEWQMGHTTARGRGISALFAGDSGTGKTMSAEVLADDLGFDLYVIDLSTVVDKYIGETEKNLDRIFTEADRVNGVLLFDEADALFGKRSEVKDARDRYANVEVAYLLQRMELFDGIAILTTNLRANVDEAFTRRLDAIVDFPLPEEPDRLRLWDRNLPARVPRGDDLDLGFLAHQFRISGGSIRNVCVSAAYFAAAGDRPIGMTDLIRATEREYRKLGRLTVEAEFGRYMPLLET